MIHIDMPMPENCRMCPACSEYDICLIPVDGKGFGEQNVSEFIDNRPNWCPLKEHEVPEELKYKMWNALYAEEDRFEKKYIGTDGHDAWFNTYRPWLQRGFEIAIKAIADWEGR